MIRQWMSCQLLVWMLVLCYSSVLVSGSVRLTILGRYYYSTVPADFGFELEEGQVYEADLSIPPPGDEMLCDYPESLARINPDQVVDFERPIALLVSQGRCSVDQKARVGLELHQKFSSSIKYIIVYNNDTKNAILVPPLISNDAVEAREELDALGFLSASTITGESLQALLWLRSDSPYLSLDGTGGAIQIQMENFPLEDPFPPSTVLPPPSTNSGSRNRGRYFFFAKFILAAIFICSPCLRAGYLWWAGGGRIVFRRNEQGRVTGLQYVAPQPHWFVSAPTRNTITEEQADDGEKLLTEEQVLALPEIMFQPDDEESSSIVDDLSTFDEENPAPSEPATNDTSEASLSPAVDASSEYRTRCTVCSICIDDFEPEERVRVLPRCGHGFHTECLMPWLTERHAFCPLCKTDVLPDESEEDEDLKMQTESQETSAESDPPAV